MCKGEREVLRRQDESVVISVTPGVSHVPTSCWFVWTQVCAGRSVTARVCACMCLYVCPSRRSIQGQGVGLVDCVRPSSDPAMHGRLGASTGWHARMSCVVCKVAAGTTGTTGYWCKVTACLHRDRGCLCQHYSILAESWNARAQPATNSFPKCRLGSVPLCNPRPARIWGGVYPRYVDTPVTHDETRQFPHLFGRGMEGTDVDMESRP